MSHRPRLVPWIVAAVAWLLGAGPASAGPLVIRSGSVEGGAGEEVRVPVTVHGAQNLGPLQTVLLFDPALLDLKTVEAGPLLANGMVEHKHLDPGRVQIGMVTGDAISGDGTLFWALFAVRPSAGKCPLKLERTQAWDRSYPYPDLPVSVENGAFRVRAPVPREFLIGGLVLLGLVFLVAIIRRGKGPAGRTGGGGPA